MDRPEPALIVVFGATGDLMRRKLLPALYHLFTQKQLPTGTQVLAVARGGELDDAGFQAWGRHALGAAGFADEQLARWCDTCLHYQSIGSGEPEDYRRLAGRIATLERELWLPGNRVFYLALPPQAFPATITALGRAGVSRSRGWTRLVIEKPFGRDLTSARELNRVVHAHFDESQIYRIDHYLGKETVQNLLVFRFANPIFETLWNRDRVERVQITVAEDVGIEGRAAYYDETGALRDMVQNHLTQLLALVAMEIPAAFEADAIRTEKVKVLQSVAPIGPKDVVFGQYARGNVNGTEVPGYREEPGVAPRSSTETFAAVRLKIENWRWHGVPFYLQTGKRLPSRLTQIVVTFRCPPVSVFQPFDACTIHSNALVITLQPDEGFDLVFEVKVPGQPISLQQHRLRFRYAEAFAPLADAYQTLVLDVFNGDQTLFVRADEVEAAWRLYDRVLEAPPRVQAYRAGTWGPSAGDLWQDAHSPGWSSPSASPQIPPARSQEE